MIKCNITGFTESRDLVARRENGVYTNLAAVDNSEKVSVFLELPNGVTIPASISIKDFENNVVPLLKRAVSNPELAVGWLKRGLDSAVKETENWSDAKKTALDTDTTFELCNEDESS